MDHGSFRAQLRFTIGYVMARSRGLVRRLLQDPVSDDARRQLADQMVQHLERSGFEIDEDRQTLRRRPPAPPHRSP